MKLKHVLAATDLSAPARHALERAALLSREVGASLDVLHVTHLPPLETLRRIMTEAPEALGQHVLDSVRARLREQADALQSRYGVSPGIHVAIGSVLDELARLADALPADLVVCGARGESFMRHLVLGSTAERMLGQARRRPVLVVKQFAHESYRTVLVPVDFSSSSVRTVKQARAVAPAATVILLHAFEVPFEGQLRYVSVDERVIAQYRASARQDAEQKIAALIAEAGLPHDAVRSFVIHGDPALCIVEQEQVLNCDLIVIGKHGENMLEELFVGSVTRHVLAESQGDVLVSV